MGASPKSTNPTARDPSALARPELMVAATLVVAAAAAVAFFVGRVEVWLSNDGPAHLYAAYIHGHLDDPATGFSRFVVPNVSVSSWGYTFLYRLLDPFLAWPAAYRLSVVLIALMFGASMTFAAARLHHARWPTGVLGFALALSWSLDMGFFSFCIGSAGVCAAVGLWAKGPPRPWAWFALAALLYATARSHSFCAIVAGLLVVVIEVARVGRAGLPRRLLMLGLAGLPAMIVVGASSAAQSDTNVESRAWGELGERITNVAVCTLSGPWWRSGFVVALALASVALIASDSRVGRARASIDLALGAAGIALCTLAIGAPLHYLWMFFAPRFAPLGVIALLLVVPFERLGSRARVSAGVAALAFAVASSAWSSSFHRELVERARPALDLLKAQPPSPRLRFPIILPDERDADLPVRYLQPFRQLGQLAAVKLGGMSAYGFLRSSSVHAALVRPDVLRELPALPPRSFIAGVDPKRGERRREQVEQLAAFGAQVDEVFLVGHTDDVEQLVALGYQAVGRREGALLARFRGCAGRLVVTGVPGTTVHVELGWGSMPQPEQRFEGALDATGEATFEITPTSCGALWVRSDGGAPCTHAGQGDRVRDTLADGMVRCALP